MAACLLLQVLELDDERELAFAEGGDPGGVPVLAFHGTPGSHRQMMPFSDAAREAGVRLIALDRPGYGHSTFQRQRRLVDWPRDVLAVADHLRLDRFGVAGISGGGPHAAVCAHALAERLLGCVIISGIGPIDRRAADEGMMRSNRIFAGMARRTPALLRFPFAAFNVIARVTSEEAFVRQMKRQLPPADAEVLADPEMRALFMGDLRRPHPTSARAAAQDFAIFARPWGFRFEDISTPVHIWHGDADRNVPVAHGHLQAERIPGAKLHLCPDKGHFVGLEMADKILRQAADLAD